MYKFLVTFWNKIFDTEREAQLFAANFGGEVVRVVECDIEDADYIV